MSQASVGAALTERPVHTGRIFWASFLTLIAAGMGFGVRGEILGDWAKAFGFTQTELGSITGGGLAGFGITIIICSLFADRVGYKALLIGAFLLHLLSAAITLAATPVFQSMGRDACYWCLYSGMFMFALGNGLCEAAINPLVATLYPKNKTHYLNILHAGWPAGLILGALVAMLFVGEKAMISHLRWEIPIALFLLPALWYGLIVIKEKFPKSETHAAGVTLGEQIASVAAPLFIFLMIIHAMVGYVELGTDSWIMNIMGNVIPGKATMLFIYTSALMFTLRFFAGPIVHKINPLGLLFVSACCGAVGLYLLGSTTSAVMIVVAATIFGIGKTFYWPTMLGVAGERFPKAGALGMGLLGGVGMLSAGFLGGPGIGYKQDRAASNYLKNTSQVTYDRYKAEKPNHFLFLPEITGLNGSKVGVILDGGGPGAGLDGEVKALQDRKEDLTVKKHEDLVGLYAWWNGYKPGETPGAGVAKAAKTFAEPPKALLEGKKDDEKKKIEDEFDKARVGAAKIYGGQKALKLTALVPVTMAICYLLLVLYFMAKGGYKQVHIEGEAKH